MLGDLASDGTIQSIKHASLSLDAEGEEVCWDVTICIKLDCIVKSIRDSPRPSKTQGVPPNAREDSGRATRKLQVNARPVTHPVSYETSYIHY